MNKFRRPRRKPRIAWVAYEPEEFHVVYVATIIDKTSGKMAVFAARLLEGALLQYNSAALRRASPGVVRGADQKTASRPESHRDGACDRDVQHGGDRGGHDDRRHGSLRLSLDSERHDGRVPRQSEDGPDGNRSYRTTSRL